MLVSQKLYVSFSLVSGFLEDSFGPVAVMGPVQSKCGCRRQKQSASRGSAPRSRGLGFRGINRMLGMLPVDGDER
jgi:hypothetical protein